MGEKTIPSAINRVRIAVFAIYFTLPAVALSALPVQQRSDGTYYTLLGETEGKKILSEARTRFDLVDARAVHRVGHLQLGELAVWVGVTAEHRGSAFDACRYIIDEAKARLPIWKKEHYASGATAWINCATRGEHGGMGANPSP